MSDRLPPQRNNRDLEGEELIKDILVQLGLQEVITYRLTTPEQEAKLLAGEEVPPDERPYVTLANTISVKRAAMRHSLLASVLEIAAANSRFQDRIALFELGQVFLVGEDGVLPDEPRRLSVVLTGPRSMASWDGASDRQASNFFDLKGLLEQLLAGLHVAGVTFEPGKHPTFRPGRTARLLLDGRQIGWMGEVHPLVVEEYDIRSEWPVLAADLDVELLLPRILESYDVEQVPAFPAVREDIALIVDKSIPAAEVTALIEKEGGALLRGADLFDIYEGASIPAGKKSLAYHLTFMSAERTLTDKAVRKNRERIVKRLNRDIGARLRDADA